MGHDPHTRTHDVVCPCYSATKTNIKIGEHGRPKKLQTHYTRITLHQVNATTCSLTKTRPITFSDSV